MTTTPIPNPGSDEALAMGCLCPVMDNRRGRGSGYVDLDGNPLWWINGDCPVHVEQEEETHGAR